MTAQLDTKGMKCPMPIIKAKNALKDLNGGDELRIEATDPGSVADFAAFCRTTGNDLVDSTEEGGVFVFVIRKAA
jgi:tRNA 2-thiouridine synthesizing protein A